MKEYILCSAIHDSNEVDMAGLPLIYCGKRHSNILWQGEHVSRNPYHQGFLTNRGRFVGREEALIIAIDAGQIIDTDDIRGDRLYSENLY